MIKKANKINKMNLVKIFFLLNLPNNSPDKLQ